MKINSIETYSIYNEGKSVIAEGFIRTLINKIFKHMTAISKNVYFDVLDDIVDKYNNTVHKTIKVNKIEVTSYSYAEYNEDSNVTKPKFNVAIMFQFQNTKTFLIKDTRKIGQKKFLFLVKLNTQFRGHMQKTNQKEFRIEKVLKRKGDKLYVKWKGYDNSFNSWIDKKDLI